MTCGAGKPPCSGVAPCCSLWGYCGATPSYCGLGQSQSLYSSPVDGITAVAAAANGVAVSTKCGAGIQDGLHCGPLTVGSCSSTLYYCTGVSYIAFFILMCRFNSVSHVAEQGALHPCRRAVFLGPYVLLVHSRVLWGCLCLKAIRAARCGASGTTLPMIGLFNSRFWLQGFSSVGYLSVACTSEAGIEANVVQGIPFKQVGEPSADLLHRS